MKSDDIDISLFSSECPVLEYAINSDSIFFRSD